MAGGSWSSTYTLLKRQNLKPRTPKLLLGSKVPGDFVSLLNSLGPGVIDLDLETQGLDPSDKITVLGLAGEDSLLAFNTLGWTNAVWTVFFEWAKRRKFSAFNAVFDFANLTRLADELKAPRLQLHGCSMVLFKMLTTEGHLGQTWSLDDAVEKVLGWDYNQKEFLKNALEELKLAKGEMWKLGEEPKFSEKFHEYCALDAEAARQLRLYLEGVAGEPVLRAWQEEWNCYVELAVESQLEGLCVDRELLAKNKDELELELKEVEGKLRAHPETGPVVQKIEKKRAEATARTRRVRLKKGETAPEGVEVLFHQPPKGKGWHFYNITELAPVLPEFNFKSPVDLRELLWDELAKGAYEVDKEAGTVTYGGRTVELTDSGALPVNSTAFGMFGEAGQMLDLRSELFTRLSFFETYLESSEKTGKIHPRMRPHGTISGRSSGNSGS